MQSEHVSKLVKIPGIIISASAIRVKATRITVQCRSCRNTIPDIPLKPGLEGYALPRNCPSEQAGKPPCPVDPFFILPDKCKCVDFQVIFGLSFAFSFEIIGSFWKKQYEMANYTLWAVPKPMFISMMYCLVKLNLILNKGNEKEAIFVALDIQQNHVTRIDRTMW